MTTILQYSIYGKKERSFINFSRMTDKVEFYYYQFRKNMFVSQFFVANAMLNFRSIIKFREHYQVSFILEL